MISAEEKRELINAVKEEMLLILPEVIGNLIMSHTSMIRINKEFYQKYPEFRDKKDIVASVVEMVEGTDTLASYDEILRKAVPEIRKRLETVKSLDTGQVAKLDRDLNGVI